MLGSCVSADVVRLDLGVPRFVFWYERSSLLSLMSPPLRDDYQGFDWPSNFAKSAVKADFEKTFFQDLMKTRCDMLFIDLVDDRWDLLRSGNTLVTRSQELMATGAEGIDRFGFERVNRLEPATQLLWRDACARFAVALRQHLPNVQVVLHRVLATSHYRDGQTIRDLNPFADGIPLGDLNTILEDCHECLLANIPSAVEIDLSRNYVANPNHRWGLGPFHFEDQYYLDVGRILRRL